MQNQLTHEEYMERMTRPGEQAKVSFSAGGSIFYDLTQAPRLRSAEDWSDEEEEEADSEDEEIAGIIERKRQAQLARTGRVNKDSFMSKHDAELCGARNARQVEKWVSTDTRGVRISNKDYNNLKEFARQQEQRQIAHKGKEEVATKSEVLDQTTRLAILGMLNKDLLAGMHGIVSTGKEAVVYHAVRGQYTGSEEAFRAGLQHSAGQEAALKIFKTTLNEFKNRAKYIEGEWRFRRQPSTQNPRKLVKTWCEKELRNLRRLQKAGVSCPTPYHLEDFLIVMQFIGSDGVPAPKLKEVSLGRRDLAAAYGQVVRDMRTMYQHCNLVHGDLSEYNLLWHQRRVYIIDVSQAVETDHPEALALLRSDCTNVTDFFTRRGLASALTNFQLFDYVSAPDVEPEAYLAQLQGEAGSPVREVQDSLFNNSGTFLPRRMAQVDPFEALASPSKLHELTTGIQKTPDS